MAWKVNPTHLLMWYSNNGCKIMDRLCCFSYMDEQVFGEAESHDYYFKRKPTMVPTEWIDDYDDKENIDNDTNKPISTMELLSRTKVIAAAATSTISLCLNNTRDKNTNNDDGSKIPTNEQDKGCRPTISSSPTAVTSVSTSSSFGTMTTVRVNSKESQNNYSCNSRNNSYDTQTTYPMTNTSTPQGQQQKQDHHRQQGNLFDDDDDEEEEDYEQRNDDEDNDVDDMSKSYYTSSPSQDKSSRCHSSPSSSPSKLIMDLFSSSCHGKNINTNTNRLELVGDMSSSCNRPSISFSKRFASTEFHDDASNKKKQRRYRRYQQREQQTQQKNQDRDDFNKMLRHIQTEGLVHLPHLRTSNVRYEC